MPHFQRVGHFSALNCTLVARSIGPDAKKFSKVANFSVRIPQKM
jgi:hypothetical protein